MNSELGTMNSEPRKSFCIVHWAFSSEMTASFRQLLAEFLPRILSQCCRDANSPSFGCFDRNFWHYRMRDFSSIILQQGGYAVLLAQKALPDAHERMRTCL